MAQWKERGYVPDSDDEEEEVVELLSRGGPPIDKILDTEQERKDFDSNDHQKPSPSNGNLKDTCLTENDYSILLAGAQHHGSTQSKDGLGESLRQIENKQDSRILAEEEQLQKDALPNTDSEAIDHSQIEEARGSVAELLRNQLASGLEIVKEVLSGSPGTVEGHHYDNLSGTSSPLSSVESFAAGDHSGTHLPEAASVIPLPLDHPCSEHRFPESVDNVTDRIDDSDHAAQVKRRNLRQRNPIQLHPYALEGARYQQEMLARGMRPVYLARTHRRRTSDACGTQDFDSREHDAGDDSQDIVSSQQESSGPLLPIHNEAVKRHPRRRSANDAASDEELPDLDTILRSKHAGLPQPRKWPKGVYGAPKTAKNIDDEHDFHDYNLPSDSAGFTLGGSLSGVVFHAPPSPPHTRSVQSSQSTEAIPRLLTMNPFTKRRIPQALPTPNISSATQPPTDLLLQFDDDSNSPETDIAESSSTNSQHSIDQGDRRIIQLRRKTKGVLPASFFRLQGQQENSRRKPVRAWSLSPDRDLEVPGVAHRFFRPRISQTSPSRASNIAIELSDDSTSEEDSMIEKSNDLAASDLPHRQHHMMGLVDGDIEEDNGVDMMLQPQSRKRKTADPGRKRQYRINEFGHGMTTQSPSEPSRWRTPKRRKKPPRPEPGGQMRKGNLSNDTALSLGLLDAPGYTDLPRVKQPKFLRVAARRARPRKTGGRQSPSRKCIRLATGADSYEANSELSKGRQGLLEQNAKAPLNTTVRKAMQQHDLPPENSHEQRLQRVPAPERGQHNPPQERKSRGRWNCERRPPPSGRTEDVIRGIVLRRMDQSNSSFDQSKITPARASDNGILGPSYPPAPVHARHRNRSGRGTLLSSTIGSATPREAQFEILRQHQTRHRILNAFGGRLNFPQLDRALMAATAAERHPALPTHVEDLGNGDSVQDAPRQAFSRPLRKRPPKQADIAFLNPARKPESSGQAFNADDDDLDALSGVVLAGLGSPEIPITRNFGVVPFREGAHLHEVGFVGEGQLSQVISKLVHQRRNLTRSARDVCAVIRPCKASLPYQWGAWDDQVSQQFSAWFSELKERLDPQTFQENGVLDNPLQDVLAAIKSLICYLTFYASFQDHQTLISFAEVAVSVSQELVKQIGAQSALSVSTVSPDLLRFSGLLLVFIFQIACIVASALVDQKLQTEVCKTFKALALVILKGNFREDQLVKLPSLADPDSDVFSIRLERPEINALVAINNLCKQAVLHVDIWDLITEALLSSIGFQPENLVTFQDYDDWWKGIFLSLPLLEFDASGLLRRRSSSPGWDLVQRLLVRFLQLFMPCRHNTSYSTRHYGRVLVQRCFDLVQVWGWQGGHAAVGTLFDAYSSNNYRELWGETPEHHFCLPLNLAPGTRIRLEKTDSGFHAFLGLLAQTVLDCRKPDADSKLAKRVLRSLGARLVPSKGEDLPRNKNPSLNDIIALRNRFDLVSVMYCTMPAEMKPNLRLLQSFVDFRTAHREACRLALECWSRLVQHEIQDEHSRDASGQKTSDHHPHNTLLFLTGWHDSVVMDLLAEYTSQSHGNLGLIEHHPTANGERRNILSVSPAPIAEVLRGALKACEKSFEFCQTTSQATALFSQRMLGEVLKLYAAGEPASNTLVCAALQIIRAYTSRCVSQKTNAVPADEDSQEYGSWDHFDVMGIDDEGRAKPNQDEFTYLLYEVHPMLRRFLSNVFGSDVVLDHAILKSTADCWYEVADALVSIEGRSWDDFMGQYSPDSWESLRQNQYSQQYKIYFLAKVVDSDYGLYEGDRLRILTMWTSALCQPKNVLYWEHLLTSVILFRDPDNELLFSPPFAVRSDAGERLEISMIDLCERRRAMIYVVLRNMHRLLVTSAVSPQASHPYSKSDFCVILKGIESTMKSFYNDLEADQQAQDDYRVFVNFVIQQMQLYVVDFYRIDPFLTDPGITSAEAYAITTALKRYSLTIQNTGVTKAMVLFLYNANERAAINDTHDRFILQLYNALLDLSQEAIERTENHESDAALLALFIQNVFPAYVGHAFTEPGHIVAGPLLRVLTRVYENLRCRSDFWNPSYLQHLVAATEVILRSTISAFKSCEPDAILESFEYLENFDALVMFVHPAMLRMYEAAQAFPDDVDTSNLIEVLLVLKDHIFAVERASDVDSHLLDIEADQDIIADIVVEHPTIRAYAEKELQNALSKTWRKATSGGWEIIGRGSPKVIKASRRSISGAAAETEMEQCRPRTSLVVREFMEAFMRLGWWE